MALLEPLVQDLRYALRACRRSPSFAVTVILSLGIAIGLNSAMFATLNALALRALPVSRPAELFLLRPEGPRAVPQFSNPHFEELRAATAPVARLAAMSRVARVYAVAEGSDARELTSVQLVTGDYFGVFGLSARQGRLLGAQDDVGIGGHPVAVISDSFWRRRFAGAPDIVGRVLTANGTQLTIVGVVSGSFKGVWLEAPVDVWVPAVMQANLKYAQNYYSSGGNRAIPFGTQREIRWLEVVGRATNGLAPAQAALDVAFRQAVQRDAETIDDTETRSIFLQQRLALDSFTTGFSNLRGRFATPLYLLLGMAAVILLVACANTANLLLARADARRREIAIRLSIGASRGRVVRQLLMESSVLVVAAVAVGLLFANWAGNTLVRMALATTGPLPFSATIDGTVLMFTMTTAIVTILVFGLAPAFRATSLELANVLRTRAGTMAAGAQKVLVVAQVALSLVLVVAAGLLVDSLRNYGRLDLGFTPERVLTVSINPRGNGFQKDRLLQLYRELAAAAEAVPGVHSAAVSVCALSAGCDNASNVAIDGYEPQPGERIRLQENEVGLRYFETVGMRIVEGRDFDMRDQATSPLVAVVNRAMVRRYFGGRNPIGRTFGDGRGRFQVVGVVDDARVNRVQEAANPMAFYPLSQWEDFASVLEVRAAGDPGAISSDVRRAVAAVNQRLPIDRVTLLSRQIELNLTQPRLVAQLGAFFGLLALALACFGLFAVMSYVVSRRTPELGIRMALGASRARVGRGVLADVLLLTVTGLGLGVGVVFAAGRLITALLFGVAATNPLIIAGAALVLVVAATVAGSIPAWRASRVDPMVALRADC